MRSLLLPSCAAALIWVFGCADGNPASSGDPEAALTPAARLTVSALRAGARRFAATPRRVSGLQTELRFDETAALGDLRIEWLEVHDSRCPADAVCIWAGEVGIDVQVTPPGGEPERHALWLRAGEPAAARARIGEVTIELLRVDPDPLASRPTPRQEYVARLGFARSVVSPAGDDGRTVSGDAAGACERCPDPMEPPKPPDEEPPADDALTGTQWVLTAFGPVGEEARPLAGTVVTLEFLTGGRLRGSTGRNDYSAAYRLAEGSALGVADMAYTEMACQEPDGVMDQEGRYVEALRTAAAFGIEDGTLSVRYGDRGLLLYAASE